MPGTKRRAAIFLLCGCLLVTPFQTAHSADYEITLKLNESIGKINGQTIKLETPPALENSTTMVPIRFVAEAIGANVRWDDTARTITITQSGKTIQLVVDQKTAMVNGKAIGLDQSANIVNGTTLVPLRFIAENLDQKVTFNDSDQSISIKNNNWQAPASAAKTTEVPAPEPRKRLDKIMADYLTKPGELSGPRVDPLYAATLPTTFEIMGVTSDNANNVYILEFNSFNPGSSYSIKKYDSQQSQLTTFIDINEKFNFDYQDKDQYHIIPR